METKEELRWLIQQIAREVVKQLAEEGLVVVKPKDGNGTPTCGNGTKTCGNGSPTCGNGTPTCGNGTPTCVLEYYGEWIDSFRKQVEAGQKAESTLRKHTAVYAHLKRFIVVERGRNDLPIADAGKDFLVSFNLYLKKRGLSQNSRCIYLAPVQMILRNAHAEGLVSRNQGSSFRVSMVEKPRGFLTADELKRIADHPCGGSANERIVRDLFLFCCYTGLSFIDMKHLRHDNIVSNPHDSRLWIVTNRKKTGAEVTVRLLSEALGALRRLRQPENCGNVFAVPSHHTCNRIMKRIAGECDIGKKVTWHLARHTMATTVCLSNGMPIESVGKILGHKKLRSTQIYAKVTQEALGREMSKIEAKLGAAASSA